MVTLRATSGVPGWYGKWAVLAVIVARADIRSQKKEHKIISDGRPDVITAWQKKGRKYDAMPDISDQLSQYSTSWWLWWRNLQPSWRLASDSKLSLSGQVPSSVNWSMTEKGTANGFFIIVLALGWWALGLKYADDCGTQDHNDFSRALGEATWVLDQMELVSNHGLGKRARDSNDNNGNTIRSKRFVFSSHHDVIQ